MLTREELYKFVYPASLQGFDDTAIEAAIRQANAICATDTALGMHKAALYAAELLRRARAT
jgi:hypothetical protein